MALAILGLVILAIVAAIMEILVMIQCDQNNYVFLKPFIFINRMLLN